MVSSPYEDLFRIQVEAQALLNLAMLHERAGKWNKVVESYSKMLHLLAVSNLPKNIPIPQQYNMLLYESFYHLGVALQNLDRHEESIMAYKKSLSAVNATKNGCLAGCQSNTCFQTPVLARRAFAYAKCDDMKNAFKDIEKAVVLDTKNPDVYCVRALLWNTIKESIKAVDDLNIAIKYNPCHVCALILKGTIDVPFQFSFSFMEDIVQTKTNLKRDHLKAKQFIPEAELYFDVSDIHNPKMITFWRRFLWSLTIPRTVLHINLLGGVPSSKLSIYQTLNRAVVNHKIPKLVVTEMSQKTEEELQAKETRATSFKCGMPQIENNKKSHERRSSYANALRTYSARLRSPSETINANYLNTNSRPSTASSDGTRNNDSSMKSSIRPSTGRSWRKGSVTFANPLLSPPNKPRSGSAPLLSSNTVQGMSPVPPQSRRTSIATSTISKSSFSRTVKSPSLTKHNEAASYATEVHGIRIYQTPNVSEAPRMYYKPWKGDKLPVSEITRPTRQITFKV